MVHCFGVRVGGGRNSAGGGACRSESGSVKATCWGVPGEVYLNGVHKKKSVGGRRRGTGQKEKLGHGHIEDRGLAKWGNFSN